ncbi:hypothetical protein lerEdw1_015881 [Lerista edwardsae]|nr:hypothetical protein lerEdw1_015881 [Lerista edwardsae]
MDDSTFTDAIIRNGLCVAFSKRFPVLTWTQKRVDLSPELRQRQANVLVYSVDSYAMLILAILMKNAEKVQKTHAGKVWIATVWQDLSLRIFYKLIGIQYLHGSLSFLTQTHKRTKYDNFDPLFLVIQDFGEKAFHCSYSKPVSSVKSWMRCKETEEGETLPQDVMEIILSQDSYSIYKTVKTVAHALHATLLARALNRRVKADAGKLEHQMLHPFLSCFYNASLEGSYPDEAGDLAADFDIVNFVAFPNQSLARVQVGSLERQKNSPEIQLTIDQDAIVWPKGFNQVGKPTDFTLAPSTRKAVPDNLFP